ncbi:hypothetical protein JCM9279_002640 [Rhodotorula babjevae]
MAVTVPLALLQGVLGAVGLPRQVVQLVHLPLSRLAALVALVGVAVQTGVLLEEYGADQLGLWLNSLASSSSSNGTTRSLPAQAAHLTYLALESYPRTVSLVLDDALALPEPAPDLGITFSPDDVAEWERDSAAFRADWTQLADEVASSWIDLLDWVPSSPPPLDAGTAAALSSNPSSSPSPDPADRHLFLNLLASELALVQARSPSRAVYAGREYSPADFAREDARQAKRAERAAKKRDAEFEEWLEGIFAGAEAVRAAAEGSAAQGEEEDGAAKGAAALRREMLDLPVGDGPGSGTWRSVLRTSWEGMFAADKGGVLGEMAQHLGGLLGQDDEDEDESAGASAEGDWMPAPLPLMANRLVRDELSATLDAAVRAAGWDLFPSSSPEHDATVLPAGLAALPFDRLTLAQRAIAIDRRARSWAQRALDVVRPPRTVPRDPTALSSAEHTALLRASPLARFLRATNALFALPRERMRIRVSGHVVAQAVFALRVPAVEVPLWQRREGEAAEQGGCSAVLLEMEKRTSPAAWESARRGIEEREREGRLAQAPVDEGLGHGAQAHQRDEL